jgi:hypothetical protein
MCAGWSVIKHSSITFGIAANAYEKEKEKAMLC